MPPVQAKQSKACMKLKPSTSPAYEKPTEMIFFFAKKKKEKKEKENKMDTILLWKPPRNSPGFLFVKQTFLYKHDGTAFC